MDFREKKFLNRGRRSGFQPFSSGRRFYVFMYSEKKGQDSFEKEKEKKRERERQPPKKKKSPVVDAKKKKAALGSANFSKI